jgi:hypothetical protein
MISWLLTRISAARSPSGKAKVCKTFIGGSIPPRASKIPFSFRKSRVILRQSGLQESAKINPVRFGCRVREGAAPSFD